METSSCALSFFSLLGDILAWAEPGICFGGGAEQTGTTVRILTAGARKLGCTIPKFILSVPGLNEHEGTAVLTLGGAGIRLAKFCGKGLAEDTGPGPAALIVAAAEADDGGLKLL